MMLVFRTRPPRSGFSIHNSQPSVCPLEVIPGESINTESSKMSNQLRVRRRKVILPECVVPVAGSLTKFLCNVCGKQFRTRAHGQYHRFCMEPNAPKPFNCEKCNKSFIFKNHFQYHMRVHSGEKPFSCSVCGHAFRTNTALKRHATSVHMGLKKYKCNKCTKSFAIRQNLDVHMSTHTGDKPFKCQLCPKAYSSNSNRIKHQQSHKNEKNHLCDICGKVFGLAWTLRCHLRCHSGDKVPCTICDMEFTCQKDVRRHIRSAHKSDRDFQCPMCDLAFKRKDNATRHYRNSHPSGPPVATVTFKIVGFSNDDTIQNGSSTCVRVSVIKTVGSVPLVSENDVKMKLRNVLTRGKKSCDSQNTAEDALPFKIEEVKSLCDE